MIASQRVAHVSTVHHPLDPRIYRRQVTTLRKDGRETWLIARDAPGRPADANFLALNDRKGVFNRLRRHVEALRHLRAIRPAVVHIHDPELIPVARAAKALYGCKVIYDMHEDYTGRSKRGGRMLRGFENWCFGWADHVVLAESSYEKILRGRSTPSTAVLNYILPPNDEPKAETDHPFTLIYTGTISNCRGLVHMLDLAREIKKEGLPWRVQIVGVSHLAAERTAAEKRIADEQLESVIDRIGWDTYVPWKDIVDRYTDADIGLALFEPLPNHTQSILSKFYEYIYFSLPVVCSDFPLWRAFFETNGCGVMVNASRAAEVMRRIKAVVADDTYARMAASARGSRSDYIWSIMEPRLLGIYDDLLGSPVRSEEVSQTSSIA